MCIHWIIPTSRKSYPNTTLSLLNFMLLWCGFCKKLAPEYEKAAATLSKYDPPIALAKVDLTVDANKKHFKNQFEIRAYPTLKFLKDGGKILYDYKDPSQSATEMVEQVKKYLKLASIEIETIDDAAKIIGGKKVFIAGVFPRFEGEEYENFTKLVDKLRSDYEFGYTLDAKVLPRGDSSVQGPIVRLLKPFDELLADSKDFDLDALEKFIKEEDSPSVVPFTMDPNNVYLRRIFTGENTKHFKLDETDAPVIVVHKSEDEKYLKTNVEPDQIAPWFKKFMDGKLELFKMSQPIPLENNEPVKVVVLNSVQDMVFNSGKDVFLEFYAPWCGHCKRLAPILDEVAVEYENDPNHILIAKFDASANDVPKDIFNVQGFPTMFFITKNKEIVEYDGGRTKEDIIEFIEKHRSEKKNEGESEIKSKTEKTTDCVDETVSAKDEL